MQSHSIPYRWYTQHSTIDGGLIISVKYSTDKEIEELRDSLLLAAGEFGRGSMGPKIEAIASFLEPGGARRAIITNPPNLGRALSGATGTHVVPG